MAGLSGRPVSWRLRFGLVGPLPGPASGRSCPFRRGSDRHRARGARWLDRPHGEAARRGSSIRGRRGAGFVRSYRPRVRDRRHERPCPSRARRLPRIRAQSSARGQRSEFGHCFRIVRGGTRRRSAQSSLGQRRRRRSRPGCGPRAAVCGRLHAFGWGVPVGGSGGLDGGLGPGGGLGPTAAGYADGAGRGRAWPRCRRPSLVDRSIDSAFLFCGRGLVMGLSGPAAKMVGNSGHGMDGRGDAGRGRQLGGHVGDVAHHCRALSARVVDRHFRQCPCGAGGVLRSCSPCFGRGPARHGMAGGCATYFAARLVGRSFTERLGQGFSRDAFCDQRHSGARSRRGHPLLPWPNRGSDGASRRPVVACGPCRVRAGADVAPGDAVVVVLDDHHLLASGAGRRHRGRASVRSNHDGRHGPSRATNERRRAGRIAVLQASRNQADRLAGAHPSAR